MYQYTNFPTQPNLTWHWRLFAEPIYTYAFFGNLFEKKKSFFDMAYMRLYLP